MSSKAKATAFIAMMAALGNALFVASQTIFTTGQVALDLSHVATYIAAIYGGPILGAVVGALVGIGPAIYFGYVGGVLGPLGLFGLPVGKALTGLTTGFLSKTLLPSGGPFPSKRTVLISMLGYVPECVFTVFLFRVLVPVFLPSETAAFLIALLTPILVKAWIEIGFISVLMGALAGNGGFLSFVRKFVS